MTELQFPKERVSAELKDKIKDAGMRLMLEIFWRHSGSMSARYQRSFWIKETAEGFQVELKYRGDDDEPLGVWFESGTRRHFIEPKVKHPSSGVRKGRQTDKIDPEAVSPRNPHSKQSPQALSWLSGGKRFFSKGHWVSGIRASRIIEKTRDDFKRELPILTERMIKDGKFAV